MTVEKGNKIFIAEGDIAANPATVNWQQNLSQKSDNYYMAVFTNKDKSIYGPQIPDRSLLILGDTDDEQSYIFIQQGKLDALKAKSSGDSFTITVDDSFQYGQKNKQGEGRFLVFHDKSRNLDSPIVEVCVNLVLQVGQWRSRNYQSGPTPWGC